MILWDEHPLGVKMKIKDLEGKKLGKYRLLIDNNMKCYASFEWDPDYVIKMNEKRILKYKLKIEDVILHEVEHIIDYEAEEWRCDRLPFYTKKLTALMKEKK